MLMKFCLGKRKEKKGWLEKIFSLPSGIIWCIQNLIKTSDIKSTPTTQKEQHQPRNFHSSVVKWKSKNKKFYFSFSTQEEFFFFLPNDSFQCALIQPVVGGMIFLESDDVKRRQKMEYFQNKFIVLAMFTCGRLNS